MDFNFQIVTLFLGETVEVMTSVLDNEEDDDGHLTCLLITQDVMNKDTEGLFLEQFAKLGLFTKVIGYFHTARFCHQVEQHVVLEIKMLCKGKTSS
jgi:hypothetical protein